METAVLGAVVVEDVDGIAVVKGVGGSVYYRPSG